MQKEWWTIRLFHFWWTYALYFIFTVYTRYILYFSIVCIYRNERLSERVYRLTRKIEKSCHSLHIWLHHTDKDRSITVFNPITGNAAYIHGIIYIRELFKNEKFTRKEFKYLPNSVCISKIYPFFSRFKIYILIYQRYLVFSLEVIKFT